MSVSEHEQILIPGTCSPEWNAAIINAINQTLAFPQNVCCEKALSRENLTAKTPSSYLQLKRIIILIDSRSHRDFFGNFS